MKFLCSSGTFFCVEHPNIQDEGTSYPGHFLAEKYESLVGEVPK